MPGVKACKLERVSKPDDQIKVMIAGDSFRTPDEDVVKEVQNTVDPVVTSGEGDGIAPIGHRVKVVGAEEETVNINTEITFESGYAYEDIKEYINRAVEEYFLEVREKWEKNDNLVVRILQVERAIVDVTGVEDVAGTTLNGAAKNYSWEKQAFCEGGTDMHVKVNYPDAVMQIREIKCSVKAGDIIGEKLENHIQELDDNITVKESRKSGIERRERILNIQPSSSSDLETRKIAVIARWCISTMYTERILQKRLQSMLGDGYNLEVNIQQKTVSVTLQLKHYKNRKVIWEMLEGIVPLDQIIDVIIIYNTYRAYKPFTYKELKAKTYDQLRTEVI